MDEFLYAWVRSWLSSEHHTFFFNVKKYEPPTKKKKRNTEMQIVIYDHKEW